MTAAVAPNVEPSSTPSRWKVWAKRLTPWVLTAAVLAYILSQNSVTDIVAEMQHGHVGWLLPLAAWVTIQGLLIAALADLWVIRAASPEGRAWPRYRDVVIAKAGVGLLEAVGYAFGRGGYGVWIARAAGTGAALAAGAVLYIVLGDLAAVTTVGTASVYLGGADVPAVVGIVAASISVVIWAVAILMPGWPWSPDTLPRALRPLVHLPRKKAVPQIALRMINIVFGVFMTWVAARTFGLDLPLEVVAVYMPVLLVIGSLPINVAGVGPISGAWLLFFGDYAEGPQILAFQLLWTFAILVAVVVRGLPFVRRLIREIADGGPKDLELDRAEAS